jgi:rubrerythrin
MQIESRRLEEAAVSEDDGIPLFFRAGRPAEGEFRCAECGYGAIVRNELPQCPMCRGLVWERSADGPLARLGA